MVVYKDMYGEHYDFFISTVTRCSFVGSARIVEYV